MTAAHCGICLNHYSIEPEKFAIFPCGHGFCTECIFKLCSQPRPKCPNCREVLHKRDAHPLHIDFIDTRTFLKTSVVEGLNQMGTATPLISVKKASQKLEKILEGSKEDSVDLSPLAQAIEDFKERIIPMFTKVDTQTEEIDQLRVELRKLRRDKEHFRDKLKKMESYQSEVTRLKTALSETERNTDEALRLAESAKDEVAAHHATANQWKKRVTELEQDNKRYRDMLDRHSNNARLQKEKNRKLNKQVAALTEKLAREEKDALSTASHEYDGDFSTHESSKVYPHMRPFPHTSSKSSRNRYYDENRPVELEREGIPSANFPSDWQIEGTNVLRKRNMNGTIISGQRRVTNPFPINLDRKGHPTKTVQLGPIKVGL